ncbi:MAG TPA: DUF4259 domain-containing protein [Candidatus Limnocylindria bacterium]|jgi:hypothetical protein|nr:DUF4259 domain-containing protein [Candidatus Limnocylindria bacterium]
MGAWGVGSFENDDALDFTSAFPEADDLEILEDAFSAVIENDELEASECCNAIAAAEVVAALRKNPLASLPESVTEFVGRMRMPVPPRLVRDALHALEAIQASSELKELWEDTADGADWHACLADLESRLR